MTEIAHEPARATLRALVAEDHAINQKFLAIVLEKFGVSYVMTNNGAEALAHALHVPFDILLFDVRMPVMSGLEALQQIRATASANTLAPAVALTAECSEGSRKSLLAGGYDVVLPKPFSPDALVGAMWTAIRLRSLDGELVQSRRLG